ncbi:MAG: FtsX-like permease family protein, partial [Sphingomonas sp.]
CRRSCPGDVNPGKNGDMNDTRLSNVVINRSAARALGFASPSRSVGRIVGGDNPKQIIGVVEDMRFRSPREVLPPTMYLFQLDPLTNGTAVVRFTGDPKAFAAAAERAWRGVAPQVPFNGRTVLQSLGGFYKSDDQAASLFLIGSALAVAIGCVGLWGLASFTTARRIREIGIRKVLGASSLDVVKLLVGQFLKPVLIANVFAWPLAFIAMRGWLAGFDDRIALSPLFFLTASAMATAIAIATVSGQAIRASRATPAWALRHE